MGVTRLRAAADASKGVGGEKTKLEKLVLACAEALDGDVDQSFADAYALSLERFHLLMVMLGYLVPVSSNNAANFAQVLYGKFVWSSSRTSNRITNFASIPTRIRHRIRHPIL